jgi:stage II sporulation protein P
MISVGTRVAELLQAAGIPVIHDRQLHDYPSYSGSYKDTLASIEQYLEKYPTIQFVFDLHRDALISNDEEKYKLIKRIDGVDAAQMMIIAGTDVNGLEHNNWHENFRLALRIQNEMEKRYEGIMRPLVLTAQRYNTHMTNGSLLFEIGTNGNTLEEALYSVRLLGDVLSDIILTFEK